MQGDDTALEDCLESVAKSLQDKGETVYTMHPGGSDEIGALSYVAVLTSKKGELASQMFAELEGILLDPVYTGKAAAALINYSKNQEFGHGPVLFIHTGGNAGLYY